MRKKNVVKILILMLSLLTMVIGFSFAWMRTTMSSKGNTITTAKFQYIVKGYSEEGSLITRLYTDKDFQALTEDERTGANQALINEEMNPGEKNVKYISIVRYGNGISFDFALSLSLSSEALKENPGAFRFRFTDITDSVTLTGDEVQTSLATYAASNELVDLTDPAITDEMPLSSFREYQMVGQLNQSQTYKVYKIEYMMDAGATSETYTGSTISANVNIVLAQTGKLDTTDFETTDTHIVRSEEELYNLLYSSTAQEVFRAGDTIEVASSFTYTRGDLIFNSAVNFVFDPGCELKVTAGNVNIEYSSEVPSSVKSSGTDESGFLITAGGFQFNAPNAAIEIVEGKTNIHGIISASNQISLTASHYNSESSGTTTTTRGVVLNGAKFTGVNGSLRSDAQVPLYIGSNTYVDVFSTTAINQINSLSGASNIAISVRGEVTNINLSSMWNTSQTSTPQIDIITYSTSPMSIVLPQWSKKWMMMGEGTESSPYTYTGNTRIRCQKGAVLPAVSGATGAGAFTQSDVIDYSQVIGASYVRDVSEQSDSTALVVYYEAVDQWNRSAGAAGQDNINDSIEDLLRYYFTETVEGKSVDNVVSLKIVSYGMKLTTADYTFLLSLCSNSDNDKLTTLDLSDAEDVNNEMPANALHTNSPSLSAITLTSLTLSRSLSAIGEQAISGAKNVSLIEIPSSVSSIGEEALEGVRVVRLNSFISKSEAESVASWSSIENYVSPLIVTSRAIFNQYVKNFTESDNISYSGNFLNNLYIDGIYDSTGNYLLEKQTDSDSYYITAVLSKILDCNEQIEILYDGSSITANLLTVGSGLKVGTNDVTISGIARGALKHLEKVTYNGASETNNYVIKLSSTIDTLEDYAFAHYQGSAPAKKTNSNFAGIDIASSSVTVIPEFCFANNYGLEYVNMFNSPVNTTTVEAYAFYKCTALSQMKFPHLKTIYTGAFKGCTSLQDVYFDDLERIKISDTAQDTTIFEGCTSLNYLHFGNKNSISRDNGATLGIDSDIQSASLTIVTLTSAPFLQITDFEGATVPASIQDHFILYLTKHTEGQSTDKNISVYLGYHDDTTNAFLGLLPYIKEVPYSYPFSDGAKVEYQTAALNGVQYNYFVTASGALISDIVYGTSFDGVRTLPENLGGHSVYRIGYGAYANEEFSNASLTFPTSITEIGAGAFNALRGITSIISASLTDYSISEKDTQFSTYYPAKNTPTFLVEGYAFDTSVRLGVYTQEAVSDGITYKYSYDVIKIKINDNNTNNTITGARVLYIDYISGTAGTSKIIQFPSTLINPFKGDSSHQYYNSGNDLFIIALSNSAFTPVADKEKADSSYKVTTINLPYSIISISGEAFIRMKNVSAFETFQPTGYTGTQYLTHRANTAVIHRTGNSQFYWYEPNNAQSVDPGTTVQTRASEPDSGFTGALYSWGQNNYVRYQNSTIYVHGNGDHGWNTLIAYPQAKTDEHFRISAYTGAIGDYAFYGNKFLRMLDTSGLRTYSGITTIGSYAFYGCSKNLSLIITNTSALPYLGANALYSDYEKGITIKAVYVHTELINTYYTDSSWSSYNAILDTYNMSWQNTNGWVSTKIYDDIRNGDTTYGQYDVSIADNSNADITASAYTATSGTTITISVTPHTGYSFSSITVTDESGNNIQVTNITTEGDTTTGTFTMPNSSVTVRGNVVSEARYGVDFDYNGNAISSASVDALDYLEGETVTVSYGVVDGYRIREIVVTDLYGNVIDYSELSSTSFTFFMPQSNVTVTFATEVVPSHNLIITQNDHANITSEKSTYREGEEVTITVAPEVGYKFHAITLSDSSIAYYVSGDSITTITFTMGSQNVVASFDITSSATHIVRVNQFANGKVGFNASAYSELDNVILTVTPDTGYELRSIAAVDNESNILSITNNGDGTYKFVMPDRDVNVEIVMAKINTVIVSGDHISSSVTVNGVSGNTSIIGKTIRVQLTEDRGYKINTITVTDSSSNTISFTRNGNEITFQMPDSDVTVAVETRTVFYLTLPQSVTGATVAQSGTNTDAYGYYYDAGSTVTITVTRSSRRYILKQSGVTGATISSVTGPTNDKFTFTFTITSDTTLGITMTSVYYIDSINISNANASADKQYYESGETATITLSNITQYYMISDVSCANGTVASIDNANNRVTLTMTKDENVTITMARSYAISYTVSPAGASGTTASIEVNNVAVNRTVAGKTVTVNVTPQTGYVLDTITYRDTNNVVHTVTGTTFTMPEYDVDLTINMLKLYNITVNTHPSAYTGYTINMTQATIKDSISLNVANQGSETTTLYSLYAIIIKDSSNNTVYRVVDGTEAVDTITATLSGTTLGFTMPTSDLTIDIYVYIQSYKTFQTTTSTGNNQNNRTTTLTVDDNVTMTIPHTNNKGTWSNNRVNIYYVRGDSTISVGSSYEFTSFTLVYAHYSGGNYRLTYGGANIESGTAVNASGNTLTLGRSNTTQNNNDYYFTSLTVKYHEVLPNS